MKVQLENRTEIRLNCLSKSMEDIKTQISRRFNIAPKTFFLFYQDQPIFKMLDSYNDKIIFVKEFLPIKFLPNEDPNLIYAKIRLRPTYSDLRRLKLLPKISTAFLIEKLLIRNTEKLIVSLGWNYLLQLIKFRPKMTRILLNSAKTRLNLISNLDVSWMLVFSFKYLLLTYNTENNLDSTEVNNCYYIFEILKLFIERSFIERTEIMLFVLDIEIIINKYIENYAIKPCEYLTSFYNHNIDKNKINFDHIKNFTKMNIILHELYSEYFSLHIYNKVSTLVVKFMKTIPVINTGLNIAIFNNCESQFIRSKLFITWIELIEMIYQFKHNFYQNRFEYDFYKLVPFIIEKALLELGTSYFESYIFLREDKYILTFDSKMLILYSDINKLNYETTTRIEVPRELILEEAHHLLENHRYLQQLDIKFVNEIGYGDGLAREYLSLLIKEIVNPDVGLFQIHKSGLYYPVPHLFQDADNDYYYRLLGVAFFYCIIYKVAIPISFPKIFYSFLVSNNINLALMSDLQELQPELYNSYSSLKNLSPDEFEYLELEWEVNINSGPFSEKYILINPEDPINRTVKFSQLDSYINNCIKELLISQVEIEMKSIKYSFSKIYSYLIILGSYTSSELKKLIEGEQIINIKLWQKKTTLSGFEEESPTLKWFWEILYEFDKKQQKILFKFATGMQAMPLHNITYKLNGISNYQLPSSNTCFYQLNIYSNYSDKSKLKEDLMMSMGHQDFLNE